MTEPIEIIKAEIIELMESLGYTTTIGHSFTKDGRTECIHVFYTQQLPGGNSLQRGYRATGIAGIALHSDAVLIEWVAPAGVLYQSLEWRIEYAHPQLMELITEAIQKCDAQCVEDYNRLVNCTEKDIPFGNRDYGDEDSPITTCTVRKGRRPRPKPKRKA